MTPEEVTNLINFAIIFAVVVDEYFPYYATEEVRRMVKEGCKEYMKDGMEQP
jgi:hypothetical protein